MICPHCHALNPSFSPFGRPIEGGRAYARTCSSCGHILGIRPHLDTDPPAAPSDLTEIQIARLRFVRWRLNAECRAQVALAEQTESPLSAA